jgi:phosphoglycolate phosphatase
MRYSTCFFDLDGTLTDSSEGITNGIRHMLEHVGIPVTDKGKLTDWIGPPLAEKLAEDFGIIGKQAMEAVGVFRTYYTQQGYRENRVYDRIIPLLERLSRAGLDLVIATSKPDDHAMMVLDHFELAGHFSSVYANSSDNQRPTKADVIRHAIDSHGLEHNRDRVIMVGDRHHDICGARQNGIDALGVLYGFSAEGELHNCKATALVPDPDAIGNFLLHKQR